MSTNRLVELTEAAVSLEIQVSNGRTGATALVAIREADTLNSWLDFNDNTFKIAAWTTRQLAMTEVSAANAPGLYRAVLDITALLPARVAGDRLIAVFDVSAVTPTLQVHEIDEIGIVENLYAIATDVDTILTGTHGAGSWQQAAVSGAALNVIPNSSSVITVGTEAAGTFASAAVLDGLYWQIQDVAGALDMYFEFLISADGIPTSVANVGRLNSGNDDLDVFAWNWGLTAWEQIGTLPGKGSALDDINTYFLFAQHVGTGANLGKVRVRYLGSGLTSANFRSDQVVLSYSVINRSVGYADGAIWVDTINGTTGAVPFINGTADNPVSTWANALTLSAALGLRRFRIAGGSSITLSASSDAYQIIGNEYTLALAGQSIATALIVGANVAGVSAGLNAKFVDCRFGIVSLTQCSAYRCAFTISVELLAAGTYLFEGCWSAVAGTGTPSLDFGALLGNTNVNFRHYSGGIEVENIGRVGTDNMSLEGDGQLILNANCVGGTIAIRGHFPKTDNAGGVVTLSDAARYDTTQVADAVWNAILIGSTYNIPTSAGRRLRQHTDIIIHDGFAQGPGVNGNQIILAAAASSMDGAYDPAMIAIINGTGAGQSRMILEYEGSTKRAILDRGWKELPDVTSEYIILAHPGREHVNEGRLRAGASDTATLNPLASSVDNAYRGQILFLRSGLGEDQVRRVESYNGTTKVAIVSPPWDVIPDDTTGYTMLPFPAMDHYVVKQTFVFDPTSNTFTGLLWIEKNGVVQTDATAGSFSVQDANGTELFAMTGAGPDAAGFFKGTRVSPAFTVDTVYRSIGSVTLGTVKTSGKGIFTVGSA